MKYHVSFDLDLRRNPYKGLYIAIEGIDGSGKTTQVENLKTYFEKKGKKVVITSEPRKEESPVGRLLRDILQSKIKVPSVALQYLYSADRVINHQTIVEPSLSKGVDVITHRCFWSAIAYGVFDKGISNYNKQTTQVLSVAQGILSMYHQFIVPDFTFYLKISAETAMKRISKMHKVKEIYETKEKLAKIIAGYDWLAEQFPKEITIINGEESVEEITNRIVKKLEVRSL